MDSVQSKFHSPVNEITTQQSHLIKIENGLTFRDINKNGKLDVYEDPRQPVDARVEDLLGQMTLEEKAGTLFINGSIINADGSIEDKPDAPPSPRAAVTQITRHQMNHFNLWQIPGAQVVANWYNKLQRFAEQTRLGIPVTIASDPRNHFSRNIFSMTATDFSQCVRRWALPRLEIPNWYNSLPTLSERNIWQSGFASRSTHKLILRPSRAGPASTALSERMPI